MPSYCHLETFFLWFFTFLRVFRKNQKNFWSMFQISVPLYIFFLKKPIIKNPNKLHIRIAWFFLYKTGRLEVYLIGLVFEKIEAKKWRKKVKNLSKKSNLSWSIFQISIPFVFFCFFSKNSPIRYLLKIGFRKIDFFLIDLGQVWP